MQRIIFITGTDTGVGKTVVTALLAAHTGSALALKPFCTGDRTDPELLAALCQQTAATINPWYFAAPVSPWTTARRNGIAITLQKAVEFIRGFTHELILVEGAGGVLTPLGENFSVVEIIRELGCEVILVAANRLGVLNQARMALKALEGARVKIALTEHGVRDTSVQTNFEDLRELAAPTPVISISHLNAFRPEADYIRLAALKESARLGKLLG